jgi:hypothetical protein
MLRPLPSTTMDETTCLHASGRAAPRAMGIGAARTGRAEADAVDDVTVIGTVAPAARRTASAGCTTVHVRKSGLSQYTNIASGPY